MFIVIPSPSIDLLFGILQRLELMGAQTLFAKLPVKGFNDSIVSGLDAAVEVHLDVFSVCPQIHLPSGQFRSVVAENPLEWVSLMSQKFWRLCAPYGEAKWSFQAGTSWYDQRVWWFRAGCGVNKVFHVAVLVLAGLALFALF